MPRQTIAPAEDMEVDCGSAKTITLVQGVWDDMKFPLSLQRQGVSTKPDFDYTNLGLLFPQNDPAEIAYAIDQFSHSYLLESDIYPHIHFVHTSADIPVFKIDYKWYKVGATVPAGFTTIATDALAFSWSSGNLSQIATFPAISGTGIDTVSSIFEFKLYRDDNVVTGDVLAKEFDIHYQKDTLGSRQAYVK